LRWEHVLFNGSGGGLIQITQGKSRAARRLLPMVPEVLSALKSRWKAQEHPQEGWVFPSTSRCGHFEGGTAKGHHARALRKSNEEARKNKQPELRLFEPYCLRHTALTRLGESGCDCFTLARIAGHSSITITQRYCHPQADAIERAFVKFSAGQKVVNDGGQHGAPTDSAPKQLSA
jgi:integrase